MNWQKPLVRGNVCVMWLEKFLSRFELAWILAVYVQKGSFQVAGTNLTYIEKRPLE